MARGDSGALGVSVRRCVTTEQLQEKRYAMRLSHNLEASNVRAETTQPHRVMCGHVLVKQHYI